MTGAMKVLEASTIANKASIKIANQRPEEVEVYCGSGNSLITVIVERIHPSQTLVVNLRGGRYRTTRQDPGIRKGAARHPACPIKLKTGVRIISLAS